MAWTVEYQESPGCVEYVFTGPVSGDDVQQATACGITAGKESQCDLYLVDLHLMKYIGTLFSLYDMVAKQYNESNLNHSSRIAVVKPTSDSTQEAAQFYETASLNRGWAVQIFDNRAAALDWLHAPDSRQES